MKKWILLSLNICLISFLIVKHDLLYMWLVSLDVMYFPLTFIVVTILAMFPVIPFGVVSGIIGAKYGLLYGGIINLTASTLAAITLYILATNVLHLWGSKIVSKFLFLEKLQLMVDKNLFWTVLLVRIIPIFPAFIFNVYAGIFRLRFGTFMLATLLGKIPTIFVFTYVGNEVMFNKTNAVKVLLIYGIFLFLIFLIYRMIFIIKKIKHNSIY